MPVYDFHVPIILDYLATFCWAVSGAAVAIHKRFDLMGVLFVAVIASTGGGLLRDGVFLNRTPVMLTNRIYLPLILVAAVFTVLFRSRILGEPAIDRLVNIVDAVGVPAFAVVGMQYSLLAGIPLPGVVFIGLINGFGGGILRDVLVDEVPAMLRPGQWAATLALLACFLFLTLLLWLRMTAANAAWITVVCYVVARLAAIRFDLRSRPLLPKEHKG